MGHWRFQRMDMSAPPPDACRSVHDVNSMCRYGVMVAQTSSKIFTAWSVRCMVCMVWWLVLIVHVMHGVVASADCAWHAVCFLSLPSQIHFMQSDALTLSPQWSMVNPGSQYVRGRSSNRWKSQERPWQGKYSGLPLDKTRWVISARQCRSISDLCAVMSHHVTGTSAFVPQIYAQVLLHHNITGFLVHCCHLAQSYSWRTLLWCPPQTCAMLCFQLATSDGWK